MSKDLTISSSTPIVQWLYGNCKKKFTAMENISCQVAGGKIDKELLHEIMSAAMNGTYDVDEELKLKIFNAAC